MSCQVDEQTGAEMIHFMADAEQWDQTEAQALEAWRAMSDAERSQIVLAYAFYTGDSLCASLS